MKSENAKKVKEGKNLELDDITVLNENIPNLSVEKKEEKAEETKPEEKVEETKSEEKKEEPKKEEPPLISGFTIPSSVPNAPVSIPNAPLKTEIPNVAAPIPSVPSNTPSTPSTPITPVNSFLQSSQNRFESENALNDEVNFDTEDNINKYFDSCVEKINSDASKKISEVEKERNAALSLIAKYNSLEKGVAALRDNMFGFAESMLEPKAPATPAAAQENSFVQFSQGLDDPMKKI